MDSNKPVTVFAVWIRVRVVGRKDESRRSSHIATARSLRRKERGKEMNEKDAHIDHKESFVSDLLQTSLAELNSA